MANDMANEDSKADAEIAAKKAFSRTAGWQKWLLRGVELSFFS